MLRTLRHHSSRSPHADLLEPALASKEGEKVKDLLLRIREHDDAFGDKVVQILKRFGAYLVGNQVADPSQVGVLNAVSKMVEDYLGIALPILGWIPTAPRLAESVNERKPLMARLTQGEPREMRAFRTIVETLLVGDVAPEEELLIELVERGRGRRRRRRWIPPRPRWIRRSPPRWPRAPPWPRRRPFPGPPRARPRCRRHRPPPRPPPSPPPAAARSPSRRALATCRFR